jgi:hypothetical protein
MRRKLSIILEYARELRLLVKWLICAEERVDVIAFGAGIGICFAFFLPISMQTVYSYEGVRPERLQNKF